MRLAPLYKARNAFSAGASPKATAPEALVSTGKARPDTAMSTRSAAPAPIRMKPMARSAACEWAMRSRTERAGRRVTPCNALSAISSPRNMPGSERRISAAPSVAAAWGIMEPVLGIRTRITSRISRKPAVSRTRPTAVSAYGESSRRRKVFMGVSWRPGRPGGYGCAEARPFLHRDAARAQGVRTLFLQKCRTLYQNFT